ncbi:MAG: hypothetical protein WC295_00855 [Methanoregula sp.]|jgi:precorrin-6B methylase 2
MVAIPLAKQIYAVDRRNEAIRYVREQVVAVGITNLEFVCGDTTNFF